MDGSAFKGTTFAGFGVNLQFPDGSSFDYSDACGLGRVAQTAFSFF